MAAGAGVIQAGWHTRLCLPPGAQIHIENWHIETKISIHRKINAA
jgi:hypothetical protein